MTTRMSGVTCDNVLALYPATGWLAAVAAYENDDDFETYPLLFWALIVDTDGQQRIDAFEEPGVHIGPHPFAWSALSNYEEDFICFVKADDLAAKYDEIKRANSMRRAHKQRRKEAVS